MCGEKLCERSLCAHAVAHQLLLQNVRGCCCEPDEQCAGLIQERQKPLSEKQ